MTNIGELGEVHNQIFDQIYDDVPLGSGPLTNESLARIFSAHALLTEEHGFSICTANKLLATIMRKVRDTKRETAALEPGDFYD